MIPSAVLRSLALWSVAALGVAACTSSGDNEAKAKADKPTVTRTVGGPTTSTSLVPSLAPTIQQSGPAPRFPTEPACSTTVTTGQSIQDAIDASTSPDTVICIDGTFDGGGSLPDPARPGIGAYYGGIVIRDRSKLTLRGLPGSLIHAVDNPDETPPEAAPAPEQFPNDRAIVVRIVDSDRIVIEGLTVDGLVAGQASLNRLLWLQNTSDSVVRFSTFRNAGGECIRLKANSQRNELHHNLITGCGVYQFTKQKEERLRKNGEGIYIGTDPEQIATTQVNKQRYFGLDARLVTDRSSYNQVHHNVIAPGPPGGGFGNECVDIKEDWPSIQADLAGDAARGDPGHNVVADNDCSGQFDPESGGFDSRGPNNVFEHNRVHGDILGAAIRLGAEKKKVGTKTVNWKASGNRVRLNQLQAYGTENAVKAWDNQPQASGDGVCGNVDASGSTSFGGRFVADADAATNQARCSDSSAPPGPHGWVGPPSR